MNVNEIPFILSKYSTSKTYNVKEATEILTEFGISHNIKKTRELIKTGDLAIVKGENFNPNDRRAGYQISEKALYDLVVNRIPWTKNVFNYLAEQQKKEPGTKRKAKKTEA